MAARVPGQPHDFLDWLAARVAPPDWQARRPLLQADGTLSLRLARVDAPDRRVSVHWSPLDATGRGRHVLPAPAGLYGAFWSDDADEALLRALSEGLARVATEDAPVFLAAGPGPDETLPFTPEGLGDLLRRQIRPNDTRVGPLLALPFEQPDPRRLLFRFVAKGGRPEVAVALVAPAGQAQARRRDLVFALLTDTRTPGERRRPDHQVERLLGFALGRALAHDPTLALAATGAPQGTCAEGGCASCQADGGGPSGYLERYHARVRHEAFIRDWNAEQRWRRFLYPISRCIVNLFRLGADDTLVVHESLECIQNEPPWLPADSAFWQTRRATRVGEYWQPARLIVTDLMEDDVVSGGSMQRLEAALEDAVARPGARSVVVLSGCLPNVMGDNPVPAMRRLSRAGTSRFYWIANSNDFGGYTAALIRDRLEESAPAAHPRDPLGLALVGGASARENQDLLDLAARVGLHPKGVVLPDVGYEVFSRVADARLFVWANQSALRDVSELAFGDLPVVLLRPASPVGVEGTFEWLRRVVEQTDPDLNLVERIDAMAADPAHQARLDELRARTGGYSLGFVVDPEDLAILADTRPVYAFSLLELLLEMGFRLRFIAYGEAGAYQATLDSFAARDVGARVDLHTFTTPEELHLALRSSGVGALFSNFAADPRARDAGLNVFSEADIQLGLEGFHRTAEHLLRLCERRPLAAYARWLGGAA